MQYLINLSEESDHFLGQLCDPGGSPHSEAVSVEDFLSAFVEEQLDDLFLRRERRKTKKDKKLDDAVRSAKNAPKRGARLLLPRMLLLRPCVNYESKGRSWVQVRRIAIAFVKRRSVTSLSACKLALHRSEHR
jgi:hypothetical protein